MVLQIKQMDQIINRVQQLPIQIIQPIQRPQQLRQMLNTSKIMAKLLRLGLNLMILKLTKLELLPIKIRMLISIGMSQ